MAKRAALLLPLLLLLALLETGARIYEHFHPVAPVDFAGGFDNSSRAFIPDERDPSWMVRNPRKAKVFQEQRFLRQKPPGTLRIAFLGESSVNILQPLLPEWAAQLRNQLGRGIEILNFGGTSYGSQRLAIVAREILDYEPDLLLIYMGHNEFEEVEQFHLILPNRAALFEWAFHSALARVALDIWADFQVRRLAREIQTDRPNTESAWLYTFRPGEARERMASFRKNLEYIVGLFSSRRIPVVLGTIPSNLIHPKMKGISPQDYEKELNLLIGQKKFAEARQFAEKALAEATSRHQSSPLENQIIRETALKYGSRLVDIEQAIVAAEPNHIPGTALFFDHCHLNLKGNLILGTEYQRAVQDLLLL